MSIWDIEFATGVHSEDTVEACAVEVDKARRLGRRGGTLIVDIPGLVVVTLAGLQ